jgi:osmotically-inducible protein OsmY
MNTTVIPIPALPDHSGLLANGFDVPHGVSVLVRDGHLTLEGKVSWNYERVRAELAVRRLRGVRSVFNNIMVKPGRG